MEHSRFTDDQRALTLRRSPFEFFRHRFAHCYRFPSCNMGRFARGQYTSAFSTGIQNAVRIFGPMGEGAYAR